MQFTGRLINGRRQVPSLTAEKMAAAAAGRRHQQHTPNDDGCRHSSRDRDRVSVYACSPKRPVAKNTTRSHCTAVWTAADEQWSESEETKTLTLTLVGGESLERQDTMVLVYGGV